MLSWANENAVARQLPASALNHCQMQIFLAVAKFTKLQKGQPLKFAILLLIVTSHSLCGFLSILVFNCQHFTR